MIDFACKQFNLTEIVKCALGLTRAECRVMSFFMEHSEADFTTDMVSESLNLNLTTVQKAVKKLHEKDIIVRKQKNLDKGGYVYCYSLKSVENTRNIIKRIIMDWSANVQKEIDSWHPVL